MGKTGHRNRIFAFIATRERDPQEPVRGFRILVKQFIKVAHPEEEQRIGTGCLGILILLHHGRSGHGHMLPTRYLDNQAAHTWPDHCCPADGTLKSHLQVDWKSSFAVPLFFQYSSNHKSLVMDVRFQ